MYRTVFWTLWERERGMIWENGIETCIISYIKRVASPKKKKTFKYVLFLEDPITRNMLYPILIFATVVLKRISL